MANSSSHELELSPEEVDVLHTHPEVVNEIHKLLEPYVHTIEVDEEAGYREMAHWNMN